MFLRTLRSELGFNETEMMQSFYENESKKVKTEIKLSYRGLIFILAVFVVLLAIICALGIDTNAKVGLSATFGFAVAVVTLYSKMFDKIDINMSKPHLFAPEQFEECYNEIVEACFKENIVGKVFRYIIPGHTPRKLKKLVIVVDNIDRCQGDVAYSLLSDIKTFLGNAKKNIVFVIPVDEDALKNQVFCKKKSGEGNKEKEEFLRKLFNVVIRIEPYSETDMFEFAKNLNQKYECGFNPETLYLASREYSQNPRRIIQLFNNLLAELEFYAKENTREEGKLYQTAICACLIMKEEYHELYEKAVVSPLILVKPFDDEDMKKKYEPFMVHVRSIFAKANADTGTLYKVVKHGYSKYDELDENFKQSVQQRDHLQIMDAMQDASKRSLQMHYLCDQLKTVVIGGVQSVVTWYFGLISKMNANELLDESNKREFSSLFEQFGYDKFLSEVYDLGEEEKKTYLECCNYVECLREEKQNKASDYLVVFFKNFNKKVAEINQDYFVTFVGCTKEFEKKDYEIFEKMFDSGAIPLQHCVDFDGNHLDKFISSLAIEQEIMKIVGQKSFNQLMPFLKNIFELKTNLTNSTYETFWNQVANLMQNIDMSIQDSEFIFLNDLNKLLHSMKTSSQKEVAASGSIQKTLFYLTSNSSSRYNTRYSIIAQIAGDSQKADAVCKFLYEVYRITDGIDINQELAVLTSNNLLINFRPYVTDLVERDEVNINAIWSSIKAVVCDFKNESNTRILRHLIVNKIDYSRIQDCILLIFENIDQMFNEQLVIDLCNDESYKTQVINDLTRRNSDFVNELPGSILPFVVNAFNDENKDAYRNNYEYLKVVVSKGGDAQKRSVKNMLTERIGNNDVDPSMVKFIKEADFNSDNKKEIFYALKDYRRNYGSISAEIKEAIDELVGVDS